MNRKSGVRRRAPGDRNGRATHGRRIRIRSRLTEDGQRITVLAARKGYRLPQRPSFLDTLGNSPTMPSAGGLVSALCFQDGSPTRTPISRRAEMG